jgi:hypothetical protein
MKKMIQSAMITETNLHTKNYLNGQLRVFLQNYDGEPIAELSIMNDSTELASNEFILKDYSENEKITEDLFIHKRVVPTNRFVLIGSHLCPICQVKLEI